MSHPKSDFLKFIGSFFEPFILPIIPAGAKLGEESALASEQLGKIPGRFAWGPKEWYGFARWQAYRTRKGDLERWQEWQEPHLADSAIAIGLRLGVFIAIDIDINNHELADKAELICVMILGKPFCVRRREGSARRVLIYGHQARTMPITKARVAFKHPLTGDEINAIEILGDGQQVVIEGPHAKGMMHYWLDGKGPIDVTRDEILAAKLLTTNDIDHLTIYYTSSIKSDGGEICIASGRAMRERPLETSKIESTDNPFYLKPADRGRLVKAMQAINLDDPQIDYYRFVDLNRALCAATACDLEFLHKFVWPWACTQTAPRTSGICTSERGVEWLEEKWRGYNTSSLGADYVYGVAAARPFLCQEAHDALHPDAAAASLFGSPVEEGDPPGGGDAGATADGLGQAGGGGSAGPLPPGFSDDALLQSLIDVPFAYRYIIERRDPYEAWVSQQNGLWVPDYPAVNDTVRQHCCVIGDAYRSSGGPNGPKIDLALRNLGLHDKLVRGLQKTSGIALSARQFDRGTWLLNTPRGVIDVCTRGAERPHTLDDLMLMQTKVSPQWAAQGLYNIFCPQWMAYIDFLANSDERYVRLLRRYGAYCLTSYSNDLFFLFMQGVPNGGKSVFQDVLKRLLGGYVKPVSPTFFIAQRDKRTFELSQLRGKRGAFSSEVPKGARWDVLLITTMLGGTELSAEGKGSAFKDFYNTAKIIVSGNHQPSFPSTTDPDGIDRRMLLLKFSRRIDEVMPDNKKFSETVVEAEGPAILMWFLEEAYKGYQELVDRGSFMGDTVEVGLELAKDYREKANPHSQWIDDDMIRDPLGEVPGKEGRDSYHAWGDRQEMWRSQKKESYEDFLSAMKTLGFKVAAPTDHKKGQAMIIYGLRQKTWSANEG
jgi:P4 family phage/plasmid primase-like protien